MIYLYVKTHNISGLKYLGKTTQNPLIYKGSGSFWKRHIQKYGNDVHTQVIFQTDDEEVFRKIAIYFSELWNVVESTDWANLTKEEGQVETPITIVEAKELVLILRVKQVPKE